MADFNEPQLTSTYTSFLSGLKDRDTDLAALFANDTVSTSNFPARAVRFNTSLNKFQRRNSANSGFEDLTSNHHFPAITIDGSGSLSVGGNITAGGNYVGTGNISGNNINVNGTNIPSTGLYRPASHTLGIATQATLRWAIDSDGRLFNNGQATHQGDGSSDLQIYNTAGGRIDLLREDATVAGGNPLGQISAYTNETADASFVKAATIQFVADGTFTNTSHPTRISFQTTEVASTTPRTVGCFDENGFLAVGSTVGANPAAPLHINAGSFTSNVAIFASEQTNNDCTIGIRGRLNNNFDNRIHTEGSNMSFRVGGNATPAISLDSLGSVMINKQNPLDFDDDGNGHVAALQVAGTDGMASIVIARGSSNSSGPSLQLNKYRTNTYSLGTALQANDVLGDITFSGTDGTNMLESHRIRTQVITTDFSGNTVAVGTGKVPAELHLRTRNNDGGMHTYMKIDHNGHIKLTPHSQPSGGGQNAYSLDIRANNTHGTGNLIRFTETDTSVSAGRVLGGIQFTSSDLQAQNSGLLGEITVEAEGGNPVHGTMRMKMAGTEHITIEGLNNHLGIHRSDPEFPLDVVGNSLFDGLVCISTARSGFVNANDSAALQVTGNTNATSMVNITRFGDATGNFPTLVFTKNHDSSASGNTACSNDSTLGAIEFQGARGSDFGVGSRIFAKTAATWGTGVRTTDLHFQVANANNLNTFMVLTNYGALHLGDNSSLDTDYSNLADARLVLVDASGPDMVLHRRDDTTGNGNGLGAIQCSDSDGGTPAPPSGKIEFIASQNHSATAKGTDIKLGMCANGSTTITNRFTFRDSGAFGVNGDTVGSSGDCLISKGNAPPEYQPVAAKAWVNFNGDNFNMNRQYNVSSVTDLGTGDYQITWDDDFSNNQYALVGSVSSSNLISGDGHGVFYIVSQNNGSARVKVFSEDNGAAVMDKDIVNVVVFH